MTAPSKAPSPSGPSARRGLRWWVVTVSALVAMGVTASLGRWQLSRADEKLAQQAVLDARADQPELGHDDLQGLQYPLPADLMHRRVSLQGFWRPQYTVWLENRSHRGQAGYWVLTPLQLDADTAVLVQRGWAPRISQDRSVLPPVQTNLEVVDVDGVLAAEPGRLLSLGNESGEAATTLESASGSSRIRHNLTLEQFRQDSGIPVLAFVIQTDDDDEGLRRDWPAVGSTADKNLGYAFQWFALCALLFVLTLWFQFIQPARHASRSS
ncbi:MAG: SURF1 family protein [Limnohabitans sp.]